MRGGGRKHLKYALSGVLPYMWLYYMYSVIQNFSNILYYSKCAERIISTLSNSDLKGVLLAGCIF